MKAKLITSLILLPVIGIMPSCKRDYLDISHSKDYSKVYMPQAANYPNEKSVVIIDSPQVIQINAFYGGVQRPKSDITVNFEIDPSLVDTFNKANGTQYAILPSENYELGSKTAVIPSGSLSSDLLDITIKPLGLIANNSYLLPVKMQSVSDGYTINTQMSTTYFLISGGFQPGKVMPWDAFKYIMPYGKRDWIVSKPTGELLDYPTDAAGNFGPATQLATGWDQYDFSFMSGIGNSIISRKADDASLWETPILSNSQLGETKQIGQGWNVFNLIANFRGTALLTRFTDGGNINLYWFNNNWDYTSSGTVGYGWNIFSTIVSCKDALLGITPEGVMTRYPIDDGGNFDFGAIVQVGTGWDVFDLIIYDMQTDALIARRPDGTLWSYPMGDDGVPGNPTQIGSGK